MMKCYAEALKLTEKDLTAKALRRLWHLTILSLLWIPLSLLVVTNTVPWFVMPFVMLGIFASLIGLITLCFTKFVNRFWVSNKYLSSWERERKHAAMAFAFQALMWVASPIMLILLIGSDIIALGSLSETSLSLSLLANIAAAIVLAGLFIPHIYLLWTTQPIEKRGAQFDDLTLADVI